MNLKTKRRVEVLPALLISSILLELVQISSEVPLNLFMEMLQIVCIYGLKKLHCNFFRIMFAVTGFEVDSTPSILFGLKSIFWMERFSLKAPLINLVIKRCISISSLETRDTADLWEFNVSYDVSRILISCR